MTSIITMTTGKASCTKAEGNGLRLSFAKSLEGGEQQH